MSGSLLLFLFILCVCLFFVIQNSLPMRHIVSFQTQTCWISCLVHIDNVSKTVRISCISARVPLPPDTSLLFKGLYTLDAFFCANICKKNILNCWLGREVFLHRMRTSHYHTTSRPSSTTITVLIVLCLSAPSVTWKKWDTNCKIVKSSDPSEHFVSFIVSNV